ncbi:calcium/sodium antiporter [Brevundimonas sp. R86498]|uniref:calcium/sodium antiporter n=1 Tax=Brevundimonas sp. R86498 TaxID=3093845 RepID=UPI0037C9EF7F
MAPPPLAPPPPPMARLGPMDATLITYGSLLGGLILLTLGGDTLVRGATTAAKRMGVSPLLIGLTLVGFGTSTPELVTSLTAIQAGSPGIAIGNVVGSNTANILLILGVTALIAPIVVDRAAFRRDGVVLVLASLACAAAVLAGRVATVAGAVMVGMLLVYLVVAYLGERGVQDAERAKYEHIAEDAPRSKAGLWTGLGLAVAGIALTIFGARLLVDGAVVIARDFGVSDTVIGLTVVAIGTSLPELVTSVMAAVRGRADVALGNVIGSNIYNVLGVLGITALLAPFEVPAAIARLDIWVMLAATALLVLFVRTGMKIVRLEGLILLAAYAGYIGWLAVGATA